MRLFNYIIRKKYNIIYEWLEKWEYAGRAITKPKTTTVWMFITSPEPKGLIWANPWGDIYKNADKIAEIPHYNDIKGSHKQILAKVYPRLNFKSKELSGELRDDVDKIVDRYESMNVRGRIVEDTLYVYPALMMSAFDEKRYEKQSKKAIAAVYKYITDEKIGVKQAF
jgi:hypothetical protein